MDIIYLLIHILITGPVVPSPPPCGLIKYESSTVEDKAGTRERTRRNNKKESEGGPYLFNNSLL